MRFKNPWRREPEPALSPAPEIVQGFESLGDNCEFGLVQRYAGADPLGLLRFNNTGIEPLIHALDTDFAHYGADGDLEVVENPFGRLVCRSRRYGFAYNTSDFVPAADPAKVLVRETKKVAYLKRRMLEDLAAGEKILVRKADSEETPDEIARLAGAIRRHGSATLLRVRASEDPEASGSVVWGGEAVMEGRVRRFAPYVTAFDIDLEPWLDLCRNAYCLAGGLAPLTRWAEPRNLLSRPSARAEAHSLVGPVPGADVEVFGSRQVLKRLVPRAVHVFSAWVWIPRAFAGERIGAAIGHYRFGWHDADLGLREAWQRVWVAARIPEHHRDLMMGLVASGPVGERFWSAGRRLEEGPVPGGPIQPPSIRIGTGSGA